MIDTYYRGKDNYGWDSARNPDKFFYQELQDESSFILGTAYDSILNHDHASQGKNSVISVAYIQERRFSYFIFLRPICDRLPLLF